MNKFDQYEEYAALIAQDDVMVDQDNLLESEEEITVPAQDKISKSLRQCRALTASLWQRRPQFDVESMYQRDHRELTSPDPLKPTSLSRQQIADIWMLNCKH